MSLSIKALKTEVTVGIIMSSGKTFSFKDNPKIWNKGWLEDQKKFLIALKMISS